MDLRVNKVIMFSTKNKVCCVTVYCTTCPNVLFLKCLRWWFHWGPLFWTFVTLLMHFKAWVETSQLGSSYVYNSDNKNGFRETTDSKNKSYLGLDEFISNKQHGLHNNLYKNKFNLTRCQMYKM